jgi:hypothetical protein
MLNILPSVKHLLTQIPRLRDSDERLMATIWFKHIGENKVKTLSAINLLQKLADGQLPSYESISRCRRKIQEEIPGLRGKKWKERHDAEESVKEEIKQMEIAL